MYIGLRCDAYSCCKLSFLSKIIEAWDRHWHFIIIFFLRFGRELNFSQLRDVIHRNSAYLEGHEPPLNTAGGTQRGWSELSAPLAVEIFPINTSEPLPALKSILFNRCWILKRLGFQSPPPSRLPASKLILFNRCWISHLKRLGFQSPPPSIKCIQTEITAGFCVCVFVLALRKPRMVCPLFRHQEQEKRWERETTEKKNWRARRQLLVFGPNAILVCGPKAIFNSFLSASARRPLHMLRRKGGQTSSRFPRVSDGSFRRTLQALRDAASVLAFPFKIFEEGPSLSLRKGESAYM